MSDQSQENRRARRLLRALTDLSKESSLTGSLERGARLGIRQYNQLLTHLRDEGVVPEGLFSANYLEEDEASFDELGVACILLETYLSDEEAENAPMIAPIIREREVRVSRSDPQEMKELHEIAELLRDRLPEIREMLHEKHHEHDR